MSGHICYTLNEIIKKRELFFNAKQIERSFIEHEEGDLCVRNPK